MALNFGGTRPHLHPDQLHHATSVNDAGVHLVQILPRRFSHTENVISAVNSSIAGHAAVGGPLSAKKFSLELLTPLKRSSVDREVPESADALMIIAGRPHTDSSAYHASAVKSATANCERVRSIWGAPVMLQTC